jgi:hypothetical protein
VASSLIAAKNHMQKLRIALAALIAPASAPLLYFLALSFGSGYLESNPAHPGKLVDELLLALLPVSYAISFGVGIPVVLVLKRLHKLNLWRCVGLAAAIGAVLAFTATYVFSGPPGSSESVANRTAVAILGLIASSVIALAFCFIAGTPARAESEKRGASV